MGLVQAKDGRLDRRHKDGAPMVTLTRITGARFGLNSDLIERIDATPDTVITLVDGTKYLVRESLDEVVATVLAFRARVLAAGAFEQVSESAVRRARLSAVPEADETDGDPQAPAEAPVLPLTPRTP
jgi:flagellar protein FlbD